MDYSSDNESKYEEYMAKEKRLDEMEERAEREKMIVPFYLKTETEKMKYYEWLDDCERSPGFAPSYYEFMQKIEKSRKKALQQTPTTNKNKP